MKSLIFKRISLHFSSGKYQDDSEFILNKVTKNLRNKIKKLKEIFGSHRRLFGPVRDHVMVNTL